MVSSVLVTGANAGLGYATCEILAQDESVKRIVLGCRNEERGAAAVEKLKAGVDREDLKIELCLLDAMNVKSCAAAGADLEGVEGLVANAGGMGPTGAVAMVEINLLGHLALIEALLPKGLKTVVWSGSEGARGIKLFGIAAPRLTSLEDAEAVVDGSGFTTKKGNFKSMPAYAAVKALVVAEVGALARAHPDCRFVTTSPGASATEIFKTAKMNTKAMTWLMRNVIPVIGTKLGLVHSPAKGAQRYVDTLQGDAEAFPTGSFFATKKQARAVGPMAAQTTGPASMYEAEFQDALHAKLLAAVQVGKDAPDVVEEAVAAEVESKTADEEEAKVAEEIQPADEVAEESAVKAAEKAQQAIDGEALVAA